MYLTFMCTSVTYMSNIVLLCCILYKVHLGTWYTVAIKLEYIKIYCIMKRNIFFYHYLEVVSVFLYYLQVYILMYVNALFGVFWLLY